MKIFSYNIHKGFDWMGKNYFLHEMKKLINASGADLVFLQEVIGQNHKYRKDGLIDAQFEFLADSVWPHFAYGKNAIYDHGHHGNLILSKFPIVSWENINLSTNSLEQRGLLLCQIQIPDLKREFYAGCLHLNLLHWSRKKQYQMIQDKVQALHLDEKMPLILAGDFNDWNKKSSEIFENTLGMRDAYKAVHGHFAKTFPAKRPLLSLDRIYLKNFNILGSHVLGHSNEIYLSDHLPLFCEAEIES